MQLHLCLKKLSLLLIWNRPVHVMVSSFSGFELAASYVASTTLYLIVILLKQHSLNRYSTFLYRGSRCHIYCHTLFVFSQLLCNVGWAEREELVQRASIYCTFIHHGNGFSDIFLIVLFIIHYSVPLRQRLSQTQLGQFEKIDIAMCFS